MEPVLIISEKPSQAKAYSAAYSIKNRNDHSIELKACTTFPNGAIITWGIGHLVELFEPHEYHEEWRKWDLKKLPILPDNFKHKPKKQVLDHYRKVKRLLDESDAPYVINATDPGREGANIFYSILNMTKAKSKKVKRLWINSLEIEEVRKGFQNLHDNTADLLMFEEAKTRQISDWIVGINSSRAISVSIGSPFSAGRIQTPVVNLIYLRQLEINNFVSTPFYEVEGEFIAKGGRYQGKAKIRTESEKEVDDLLIKHGINGKTEGVVTSLEKKEKKKLPPRLHSLSSLQATINRRWKYSPAEVLNVAQSLYEKKILSYPRTLSHFITNAEFNYLKENFSDMQKIVETDFEADSLKPKRRFVNDEAVAEHHAIIPTKNLPSDRMLNELSEKEKNIYLEVLRTTLAMFHRDYLYEETKVVTNVNELLFESVGNVEKDKGWQALFSNEKKSKDQGGKELPILAKNEVVSAEISKRKGMTSPPKPYTEGQLIGLMKNAGRTVEDEEESEILKEVEGLGTEATRSGIIETIKNQKYIEVNKNMVNVTEKGILLCKITEGTLLASPVMTAKWESYLKKIRSGEGKKEVFLKNIEEFVKQVVTDIPKQVKSLDIDVSISKNAKYDAISACPSCEKGNIVDRKTFYGCDEYKNGCKFTISKRMLGKNITKTNIKRLCDKGRSNLIKGFKSKKGKLFDAYLTLNDSSIKFEFPKK